MGLYVRYPLAGVPTYATSADLPALAGDGALAVTLDDDILHVFNLATLTWLTMSGPTSVLAVGTIDTQTASANGAVIASNQIFMQSASATRPGLVNNTTQTLAGAKTFNTSVISPLFQSTTANTATAGQIRLANTDLIEWSNSGHTGNFTLSPNNTGFSPNAADMLLKFPSAGAKLTLEDSSFDGYLNAAGRLTLAGGGGGLFLTSGDVFSLTASTTVAIASSNVNLTSGNTLSGNNSGDVTLATIGSTPNGAGASLSGQVLTLQPANGSNPGLLTIGAQTIAGDKTFSGSVTASNFTPLPTGSTVMTRDINANVLVNNIVENFTTTVTAAGTTTITGASNPLQQFTGSTTQSVKLPDATMLVTGATFVIFNRSSGIVTVKDNGSNTVQAMASDSQASFCLASTATTNGSWDVSYTTTSAANAITALTGDVTATGPGSVAATIANLAVTNAKIANTTIDLTAKVTGVLPNANTTAASANTASAIVARDGSGNFIAGTITAALTGTASGNTTYSPNNHGVVLSGAANAMTVIAPNASTAFPLVSAGASADPTWAALTVPGGGTGVTSATAYAVLCGGTTSTGAFQSVSGVGSSGNVLTSNGAGALPTWQASTGVGNWTGYTPTFTGFGTVTNINCFYKTVGGDTIEIQGRFTSGTSTATEARISLPGGYTSNSTNVPVLLLAGSFTYSSASAAQGYMLIEQSVTYMTFGLSGAVNAGLTKVQGSTLVGAGVDISFRATIPI